MINSTRQFGRKCLFIQSIHCLLKAKCDKIPDGICSIGCHFGHGSILGGFPLAQYIIGLLAGVEVFTYTNPQPEIMGVPEFFLDVPEPVVATVSTSVPESHFAQIQVDVIHYDEQVFRLDPEFIQPVFDGLAAQVHEGGRFEQNDGATLVLKFSYISQLVTGKLNPFLTSQQIGYVKSYIVSGALVFGANVAQSGYKIFHRVWFRRF